MPHRHPPDFGKSSGKGDQSVASLSPLTALMGQAFGIGTQTGQGGIQFGGTVPDITGGSLFNSSDFRSLGDIFQPTNSGFEFDVPQLGRAVQGGFDTLTEASQTGLIDPAVNLSRQLFGDFVNDTQEQLGSQLGIGTGDSDFGAILGREAQRSSTELGNLAQERRLAASQALPGAAGGLASLEEMFRDLGRGRDPGQQSLETLLKMGGISTQGQGVGNSKQSSFNLGLGS